MERSEIQGRVTRVVANVLDIEAEHLALPQL